MSASRCALCGVVFLLQLTPVMAVAAEVGSSVPAFDLPSLSNLNESVTSATVGPKLLYVDFWSAWCGPCRDKMPKLNALYLAHEQLEVIGINVDRSVIDAYQFVQRYPVSYPIGLDPGSETARSFGVTTLPAGFLIDQQGIIRAATGPGAGEDIDRELERLTHLIETLAFSMPSAETSR